ncbi:MAG: hypothetical protein IJ464_03300 [Alistipes sp.]|nr:hypothetical protein [Alistipes sp.]
MRKPSPNKGSEIEYQSPRVELITVSVEGGFTLSDDNDQEPSPWEDM